MHLKKLFNYHVTDASFLTSGDLGTLPEIYSAILCATASGKQLDVMAICGRHMSPVPGLHYGLY